MKKPKGSSVNINFIDEQASVVGKVIRWIAIYGIIFVIATSAVVIGSTAWNLVLDHQIASLDRQIDERLAYIGRYAQFERDFLVIQDMMFQYRSTLDEERMEDLLPKLSVVTPRGVAMNEMAITPTDITISGTALTQNDLSIFIQNIMLIENEEFEDGARVEFVNLSVNQIASLGGNQLGFEFNIMFDYQFI